MTREEAAAKALAGGYEDEAKYYMDDAKAALEDADAHDAAHGIHRVSLDDEATIDRAARALNPKAWDDPLMNLICHGQSPEEAHERSREYARGIARAVLAAAVEAYR